MKKLVFSFGRFNPPTTGHEVLLKKVVAVAKKENADAMVYSSQSNDPKKNPLPYKEKTKFMKAMFPKHKKVIQYDVGVKNAFDTLSTVYAKGYRDVTMVVGSDRVTEFEKILNKYNDVEGRHGYYNFESGVKVVSAGARDPDAEGVTGMSASKMRAAAAANDFESFEKGMPAGFKGGQSVFDAVRKGMNLSEEMMEFMESDIEGLREFFETDLVDSLCVINDVELFEFLSESTQNGLIGLDQIKKFESVVDKLFAKYDIDFNFTRHFGDRMDDSRNNPSITLKELAEFIKKMYKRQGKSIKSVAGAEAVLKDIQSDLNIPVAVTYDRNNDEFDVVLKTIMRKKNFTSPDKVIKYEENDMTNQLPEGFMDAILGKNMKKKNSGNAEQTKISTDIDRKLKLADGLMKKVKPLGGKITRLTSFRKTPIEKMTPKDLYRALNDWYLSIDDYLNDNPEVDKRHGPTVVKFYSVWEEVADKIQDYMWASGYNVERGKRGKRGAPNKMGNIIADVIKPGGPVMVQTKKLKVDGKLVDIDYNVPKRTDAKWLKMNESRVKNVVRGMGVDPDLVMRGMGKGPHAAKDKARAAKEPKKTLKSRAKNVARGMGVDPDNVMRGMGFKESSELPEGFMDAVKQLVPGAKGKPAKGNPAKKLNAEQVKISKQIDKKLKLIDNLVQKVRPLGGQINGLVRFSKLPLEKMTPKDLYRVLNDWYKSVEDELDYGDDSVVLSKKYGRSVENLHERMEELALKIKDYMYASGYDVPHGGAKFQYKWLNKVDFSAPKRTDAKWLKMNESVDLDEVFGAIGLGFVASTLIKVAATTVMGAIIGGEIGASRKKSAGWTARPRRENSILDLISDKATLKTMQKKYPEALEMIGKNKDIINYSKSIANTKGGPDKEQMQTLKKMIKDEFEKSGISWNDFISSVEPLVRKSVKDAKKKIDESVDLDEMKDGDRPVWLSVWVDNRILPDGVHDSKEAGMKFMVYGDGPDGHHLVKTTRKVLGKKRAGMFVPRSVGRHLDKQPFPYDDGPHYSVHKESVELDELKIDMPKKGAGLGITRDKMPQVDEKDYPEYFAYLKEKGITLKKGKEDPNNLKPIQKEFAKIGVEKSLDKMLAQKDKAKFIIVSKDDYIVDGHHRWLAAKNGRQQLNVMRANVNMKELLKATNEFPKTTFKSIKNVVKNMQEVRQDSDIKDKKGTQPAKYYASDADGDKMSKSTKEKRAAYFAKGGSKKPAPGDKGKRTKESEHTKKYRQMFGETKPCWDGYTQQGMKKKGGKMVPNCVPEETVNEEKIDGLVKKSEKSGISYGILKKVYDRGMAAWKSGHRPGTTAQQWAFARVNSFVTKGKGTWGKADKDLAAKVRSESFLPFNEKLDPNKDDMSDYVKDFKKSKAPQFKGKSDDKRKEMAVAAYLAAKEKTESVDEDRDYKKERENYLGTPKQMERNAARSRARRLAIKKGMAERGDGKDIHHKDNNPMNNDPKNLSSVTQKYNRSEPRKRDEATSMRTMKLINKIKNSGVVKKGSMSKDKSSDRKVEMKEVVEFGQVPDMGTLVAFAIAAQMSVGAVRALWKTARGAMKIKKWASKTGHKIAKSVNPPANYTQFEETQLDELSPMKKKKYSNMASRQIPNEKKYAGQYSDAAAGDPANPEYKRRAADHRRKLANRKKGVALANEKYDINKSKEDRMNDKLLTMLHKMVTSKGKKESLGSYAFTVAKSFKGISGRELEKMYIKNYGMPESVLDERMFDRMFAGKAKKDDGTRSQADRTMKKYSPKKWAAELKRRQDAEKNGPTPVIKTQAHSHRKNDKGPKGVPHIHVADHNHKMFGGK